MTPRLTWSIFPVAIIALGFALNSFAKETKQVDITRLLALSHNQLIQLNQDRSLSREDKQQRVQDLIEFQAHLECLAHQCGQGPCTSVEQFGFQEDWFEGGWIREYQFHENRGDTIVIAQDQLSEISSTDPSAPPRTYYFSQLVCSDEPHTKRMDQLAENIYSEIKQKQAQASQSNYFPKFLSNAVNVCFTGAKNICIKLAKSPPHRMESDIARVVVQGVTDHPQVRAGAMAVAQNPGVRLGVSVAGSLAYKYVLEHAAKAIESSETLSDQTKTALRIAGYAIDASGIKSIIEKRISSSVQENLHSTLPRALLPSDKQSLLLNKRLKFEKLNQKYEMLLSEKKIFEPNRPLMNRLFAEIDRLLILEANDEIAQSSQFNYAGLDKLMKFAERALHLPNVVKKIDPTTAKIELEDLLRNQPPEIKIELALILDKIVDDSYVAESDIEPRKSMIYFYGKPATGKTRIARKMAQALKVDFKEILVAGRTWSEIRKEIERALENSNSLNVMLFFDEIGEALNKSESRSSSSSSSYSYEYDNGGRSELVSTLLPFTEAKNTQLEAISILSEEFGHYGGGEISLFHNIGRIIVVMASNYPIQDEALRQRFATLDFKKIPWDTRQSILFDIWNQKLNKYELANEPMTATDKKILSKILKIDDAYFDGVRVLDAAIDAYVYHKKSSLTQPRLDLFDFHKNGEIQRNGFDVEGFYKKYIQEQDEENEKKKENDSSEN